MNQVCAKSWGSLALGWRFCTLPKGHEGDCSSAGVAKLPTDLYFEEQPEAIAHVAKQIEEDQKMNARKEAKRNTP